MNSPSKLEEEEEEDFFDLLPDHLLLLIFNKLSDSKALTQCLLVSKRFYFLVLQIDNVFLSIATPKPISKSSLKLSKNPFKILFNKFVTRPLQFFQHIIAPPKSAIDSSSYYYSPTQVLKHFKDVKFLHIEVPSHCERIRLKCIDSLLKWKADFGRELKTCIVLSAVSFQERKENYCYVAEEEEEEQEEVSGCALNDDELKLRIAWTISCLIDASARHSMLKKIVAEHPTLENVMIGDVNKQGKLCVGRDQILEMKSVDMISESSLGRTRLPDLRMELWYLPVLELPGKGYLMKGATLVLIRPVDGFITRGSDEVDLLDFDGEESEMMLFDEAVKKMMKMKKSYVMTMNSFLLN